MLSCRLRRSDLQALSPIRSKEFQTQRSFKVWNNSAHFERQETPFNPDSLIWVTCFLHYVDGYFGWNCQRSFRSGARCSFLGCKKSYLRLASVENSERLEMQEIVSECSEANPGNVCASLRSELRIPCYGKTPYEHSRVAQFPPMKCLFLRKTMNIFL